MHTIIKSNISGAAWAHRYVLVWFFLLNVKKTMTYKEYTLILPNGNRWRASLMYFSLPTMLHASESYSHVCFDLWTEIEHSKKGTGPLSETSRRLFNHSTQNRGNGIGKAVPLLLLHQYSFWKAHHSPLPTTCCWVSSASSVLEVELDASCTLNLHLYIFVGHEFTVCIT